MGEPDPGMTGMRRVALLSGNVRLQNGLIVLTFIAAGPLPHNGEGGLEQAGHGTMNADIDVMNV